MLGVSGARVRLVDGCGWAAGWIRVPFLRGGGPMGTYYEEDINYAWIKQTARERGVSVTDLIALAPQNDPFYTGTPSA